VWNDLSTIWQVCLELAWESYHEGSVPIGAVLATPDGGILSRGRNRSSVVSSIERTQIIGGPLAHAEINALLGLEERTDEYSSCELYTLVEPCPLCIGALCMAGVKVVRFAARDAWSGSTDLLGASPYLRWKRIRAIPPHNAALETLVHIFQVEHQLRQANARVRQVLRAWAKEYPGDVRLGREIAAFGGLQRMLEAGAAIEDVVSYLWGKIGTHAVA
jgi:tRNA(Arg) A34 adenosine deaminase TadA